MLTLYRLISIASFKVSKLAFEGKRLTWFMQLQNVASCREITDIISLFGFPLVTAVALTLREFYICAETSVSCINRACVSPFSKLRFFVTNNDRRSSCWKPSHFYAHYTLSSSCWALVKMIYLKLIIIGSHVTVGAPRERGMFGGVR